MSFSEWTKYKLGNLVDEERGISYGIVQPGEFLKEGGVPILKVNNLTEGKVSLRDVYKVTSEVESKFSRSRLTGNEILISLVGSLGHILKVSKEQVGWNVVRAIGVLPIKKELNRDFIYWALKQPEVQTNFINYATHTVQATLNLKELRNIEITIPPFKIQKQIASILSSLDDKIELNRQTNKTLEAIAQTLFTEMCVPKNGVLPEGWNSKKICDFGHVVTGKTPSSKIPDSYGEVIAFVTPTDFKNYTKILISSDRNLSIKGKEKLKNKILPKNSVLVTCIGSDMGKIVINKIECITNQQINAVIVSEYLTDFLYYSLINKYGLLRSMASGGSTMPMINKSQFEQINIIVPTDDILKNFSTIVSSINEKLENNLQGNKTLIIIRDSILPKIMKGEIITKNNSSIKQIPLTPKIL